MLDAERCVLCSRCLRFEATVTGTNSFEFRNRGDHTQIATFEDRPITHHYAGNLADVCPVGALLSHDFRFKMRVWFLKGTESVCPGCSTGCNIFVDHRDDEVHRLRPRRNVEVNRSWMCDIGRVEYKEIALETRLGSARIRSGSNGGASWAPATLDAALDVVHERLQQAGSASAFVASPQATNEDLYAFRLLAEKAGGRLDFRVGDPQQRTQVREDHVLLRADRNPNTTGALDLGLGRDGVDAILADCRAGKVKALVLQGPELLRLASAADALAAVPFIAVMASHDGPGLESANVILPASAWAEVDGTFTNYQRRVQRIRRAVASPGDALQRWELAGALLRRMGAALAATSARELFVEIAKVVPAYAGLDVRAVGMEGRVIPPDGPAPQEARA
jgi:NADH-quinone oxidoreductase subunit G